MGKRKDIILPVRYNLLRKGKINRPKVEVNRPKVESNRPKGAINRPKGAINGPEGESCLVHNCPCAGPKLN